MIHDEICKVLIINLISLRPLMDNLQNSAEINIGYLRIHSFASLTRFMNREVKPLSHDMEASNISLFQRNGLYFFGTWNGTAFRIFGPIYWNDSGHQYNSMSTTNSVRPKWDFGGSAVLDQT